MAMYSEAVGHMAAKRRDQRLSTLRSIIKQFPYTQAPAKARDALKRAGS